MSVYGEDVGAMLREARERRGLTLRQVAATTRISVANLEALEQGNLKRLPGGIFTRAFVRSYALEVGLDGEEMVRLFVEQFPVEAVTIGSPLATSERDDGFEPEFQPWHALALVGILAVGLVAVALVVFWWRGSLNASASVEGPFAEDAPLAGDPPPVSPASGRPAAAPLGAAPLPPTAPAPAQRGIHLTLAPDEGPCWARITADGRHVFEGLLPAGGRETRQATRSMVVTVGDAGRCRLVLNGRPARPLGRPGEVVRITITPETMAGFWR